MLKDCDWSIDRDYKTGSENEPLQFYLDGLANSNEFSLLLGYFSSSAINLLSVGFATFISKGGKMKMVINHLLSAKDKDAISIVEDNPYEIRVFDLTDIVSLSRVLDEYDKHFFECLAYLISEKRIEIKVIKPKNGKGIAHYKSGVFSDGQDSVGYQASCNFTYYGLSENMEQLEAFLSWENGRSNKLIRKQLKLIDDYFTEKDEDVEYIPVSDIEVVLKDRFGKKDINELLVQEEQLLKKKHSLISNPRLKKTIANIFDEIEEFRRKPRFPHGGEARSYQIEAYKNWLNNDSKGLFAMATGTGKTITALNCLLEEYKKSGTYYAIILVPSKALLEQWIEEVSSFNFSNILVFGGGFNGMQNFPNFVSNFKAGLKKDVILISTYASFCSDRFLKNFTKIQDDFTLIADEAHNMGASQLKQVMAGLTISKRIGLSATPNRKYDAEGTDSICEFFHDKAPFCYNFGMKRAMKKGYLTDYYYYPRIVQLDEDEKEEYVEISNTLLKFFDFNLGKFKDLPIVERLLLKRKTIIHQARRKIPAYKEILKELDEKGKLKYVFTYVPVGSSREENNNSDDVANKFVYQYLNAALEVKHDLKASTYTSDTEDRVSKIKGFSEGKIDMLLAMKMLDEGVDIPRTEVGIFASSTGNPREFIQRRGRLLRKHKDKKFAYVYDMIVAPIASRDNENLYRIERNLIRNELIRVAYFASLSMNFYDSRAVLQDICDKYDFDLDIIINDLGNE
jgi:superfamily II DNA or RNA helicase